jgi:hypothetical protein
VQNAWLRLLETGLEDAYGYLIRAFSSIFSDDQPVSGPQSESQWIERQGESSRDQLSYSLGGVRTAGRKEPCVLQRAGSCWGASPWAKLWSPIYDTGDYGSETRAVCSAERELSELESDAVAEEIACGWLAELVEAGGLTKVSNSVNRVFEWKRSWADSSGCQETQGEVRKIEGKGSKSEARNAKLHILERLWGNGSSQSARLEPEVYLRPQRTDSLKGISNQDYEWIDLKVQVNLGGRVLPRGSQVLIS